MEKTFEEKLAEAKANVEAISPVEAYRESSANTGAIFIDPRKLEDILATTGLIPGAHSIPLANLVNGELPEEIASPDAPIITACQGGPMGAIAAYALKQRGYTNVHFIDGGTQGWINAGLSTIH